MRCVTLIGCWIFAALPTVTQIASEHPPLRGLPGVAVVAEATAPELRSYGIDDDWLRDRAVGSLERAGVPMVTRPDAASSEHQPLLVVRLQTTRLTGTRTFAWHLSVTLYRRMATLGSAPDTALCQAWTATSTLGASHASLLAGSVRESLELRIGEFASEWNARPR